MMTILKTAVPLILYIGGIVTLILCLAGRPQYGLYFLIPLLPLQNVLDKLQGFPFGNDFNDIILLSVLIGWIVSKMAGHGQFMTKSTFNVVLMLYFLFTYSSLWLGSFYLEAPAPINIADPRVQSWKNYMLLPFLFFLSANNLKDAKEIRQLLILMILSMVVMDYYNIKQIGLMTSWFSRSKIHGTFVYLGANEVAAFHATYTFVLIGMLFYEKKLSYKIFLTALILCGFYIVLFMFSRGEYLATIMATLFIACFRSRKLFIPLILAFIFWHTIVPSSVVERMKFTEHEGELDVSASTRLVLWEQSLEYFEQNPIMGVGYNVFTHVGMHSDTHNVFLRTLAEQGLIGISFLLIIMLLAIRRGWILYKKAEDPFLKGLGLGFAACAIAVMVGNFFGDRWSHLPLAAYFWVLLGMVERGNALAQESEIKKISVHIQRGKPALHAKHR